MDGHAETYIRFVRTILVHSIVPAHARERIRNIHVKNTLEELSHHRLEGVQHILLLHERHLAVDLCKLRLTVSTEVLVTEATHDLEITVVTCHHKQLLECLRRLRQRIEFAYIHSGRNHEVTRALRSRLDEIRSLYLHKSLGIQEITNLMRDLVTNHERILERISSPPSLSSSIVNGGVTDLFKIWMASSLISTSPVSILRFLLWRSITSPSA